MKTTRELSQGGWHVQGIDLSGKVAVLTGSTAGMGFALKWEHINLTGDYHWHRDGGLRNRKLRPPRNVFAPPRALP
jgi:hypothetical protein